MNLDEVSQVLAQWARSKPLVMRVHIFGSRARDDFRPDSDLDVAIELDPREFHGADESGGCATWMLETGDWQSELQSLLIYKVQLEQYLDESRTPTIARALKRSSHLAYEKSA